MRVAIVDPATWSAAYDMPLAEALARAGCEVTVHCTESPHVGLPTTSTPGVRVRESFYRRAYSFPWLPRRVTRAVMHPVDLAKLTRRLRREADVVHVQWLPGRAVDARAWARLARDVPVTFTAHNATERQGAVPASMLRGFSAVIAHSDAGAAALRAGGVEHVWRMTIGAYDQYSTMPDPEPLPVSVPAGAPLAVFAGLLRAYKGIDVLLDAWPRVRVIVPDAHLVIAGRPVDVTLPQNPPEGVTVLPRFVAEDELGWLLRRADVCVLPYRAIDMSGVAVSALACGTPLVASDIGGFGEYAGRGALLVPPQDPTALAEALGRVLGDRELRAQLADEVRVAVAEHYDWDRIAARYLERYASLSGGSDA